MSTTARERARALISVRRFTDAVAAAREGLVADPDDYHLQLLLATALSAAGDHGAALTAAERALAQRPDSAAAHRIRGWSCYKAGRPGAAKESLSRALALEPDSELAHVMLADVILRTSTTGLSPKVLGGSVVLATAEHHGAEAIRLAPTDPGGYLVRAKACIARNDAEQAAHWAGEALARQPDHPVGHQLLGMAEQLRGRTAAAADHFVAAGRLDPTSRGSIRLLRGLRRKAPLAALLAFVGVRLLALPFKDAGGVIQIAGMVLIAAFLVGLFVVWPRLAARREMSDEARSVLRRDRQLGRG